MPPASCEHLAAVTTLRTAQRYQCDECVKTGDGWVHLRTCQTCGATLCCDQSPNRHTRQHVIATQHVVVASAEPGERWLYCFADDDFLGY
jgi:hypothetical protein